MADLNLEYYNGQDIYSDGDIEDKMLQMANKNINIKDLNEPELPYPVIYHFSHLRENILNWYPFDKNANILEVGSGCGAITGLLCSKAKKVVSVELSKRRATINYYRHIHNDNLEIIVGNINDINFNINFDYIILNGVFEYASSFTQSDKPYETFLMSLVKLLNARGRILISIENRLGLKYFAGACEDHTGNFFTGLNEYVDNKYVKTFSKSEMTNILEQSGLMFYNFYYPYPDYKFPSEIFTDDTLLENGYGRPYGSLSSIRLPLFNESRVTRSLAREKVLHCFTNSFLIEASKENVLENNIHYVKLNNDRRSEFRIATLICQENKQKVAIKKSLNEISFEHIKKLYDNSNNFKGNNYYALNCKFDGEKLVYPFISEKSLDSTIRSLIVQKDVDGIIDILKLIYSSFLNDTIITQSYHTKKFAEVFGDERINLELPCVRQANIDLICDNIYFYNNKFIVIDCEWFFDFQIPSQFIIWRTINELYTKYIELNSLVNNHKLMMIFNIDEHLSSVFKKWAVHFAEVYVRSNELDKYYKMDNPISLDDIYNEVLQVTTLCSKIYYDLGEGFSENSIIVSSVELKNKHFTVCFEFENINNIIKLRWDPVELKSCICTIESVEANIPVLLNPINAEIIDNNAATFITNDPIYFIEGDVTQIKYLKIRGYIEFINYTEIVDKYNIQKTNFEAFKKKLEEQLVINERNIQIINNLNEFNERLENSINLQHNEIEEKIKIIQSLRNDLQLIFESKGWKLIYKYRNIRKMLRRILKKLMIKRRK